MIKKKVILFCLTAIILLGSASSVFALNWPKSPGIPGTAFDPKTADLKVAIQYFYEWAIVLGGLAAFIMLLVAGFQYLTSTGDPTKTKDARDRIGSAIGGLVLLLASFLILNIVNPEFTALRVPSLDPGKGEAFNIGKGFDEVVIPPCEKVIVYADTDYKEASLIGEFRGGETKTFDPKLGDANNQRPGSLKVIGNCIAALYQPLRADGPVAPFSGKVPNLSLVNPDGFGFLKVISNTTPVPAGASTLTFNAKATVDGKEIRGTAINIRPGTPVTLSWGISGLGFNSCQAQSDPSIDQWDQKTTVGSTTSGTKIISGLTKTTTFFLACSGSKAGAVAPPEQPKSVSVSVTEQPIAKEDLPTVVLTLKKESFKKGKDDLVVAGVPIKKDEDKQIADQKAPVVDFPSDFNPKSDIAHFTWTPTKTARCLGQDQLVGFNSNGNSTGSANRSISPLQTNPGPGTYVFATLCEGERGGAVYAPIKINIAP